MVLHSDRGELWTDFAASSVAGELRSAGLLCPFELRLAGDGGASASFHEDAVVSYCHEWNAYMLRDALVARLQLDLALIDSPFVIRRVHPNDLTFVRGKPQFFNLMMLSSREGREFDDVSPYFHHFFFPLSSIGGMGEFYTSRGMMQGVHEELHLRMTAFRHLPEKLQKATSWLYWLRRRAAALEPRERIAVLLDYAKSVSVPKPRATYWSEFYGKMAPLEVSERSSPKQKAYADVLARVKGRATTVLDIGSNEGWFSCFAAKEGFRVIACDYDVPAIVNLYERVKAHGLNLLPLCANVAEAIHEHSISSDSSMVRRFRSDIVVWLALSHHLVLQQGLSFEQISGFLSDLCADTLITDFVPPEDTRLPSYYRGRINHRYDIESVVAEYRRHFRAVEVRQSDPTPRKLLICTKSVRPE